MAIITKEEISFVGYPIKTSILLQGAQHDIVVLSDPGALVIAARISKTGGNATLLRSTMDANNTVGITATQQRLLYNGATANARLSGGYYMMIDNEIIYVGKDSGYAGTSGTLTGLVRGALGTTAATHSATDKIYILNSFLLEDVNATPVELVWLGYPPDPRGVEYTV